MPLLLIMLAPVIMAFISLVVFIATKSNRNESGTGKTLIVKSIKYALAGAGITLLLTIAHMIWYEQTTGYSAGNGPLGWIFVFGPLGTALGQLLALIKWCHGKSI